MIYNIVFLIVTLYILLKTIGYAIYEMREKNNKTGGVCLILLSLFSVAFSNIMIWITS